MSTRPDKFTAGFTIAELLIALAITALLLAAVAVAFNASLANYRDNENIFKTINTARQALFRITSQIRTALVDDSDISNENICKLIFDDLSEITYRYDSGTQKLYLNDGGTDYVLCENVTAMTFKKNPNSWIVVMRQCSRCSENCNI